MGNNNSGTLGAAMIALSKGYKFTQVGWNAGFDLKFTDDLSTSEMMTRMTAGRILESGAAENFEQALGMTKSIRKRLRSLNK